MMSKFVVGQRVMVAPDIADRHKYPDKSPTFAQGMRRKGGFKTKIKYISANQRYRIEGDEWNWHEDWLVPLAMNEDEAFEMLLNGQINDVTYETLTKGEV
jgi:hypothetical protein